MNINRAIALACELQNKGEIDQAEYIYKEIIKIQPDNVSALYNLGIIFQDKAQPDEAIFYYKKALDIDANLSDANFNIGLLLHSKGLFDDAIKNYQKALEYDQDSADLNNNLGAALKDKGELDEAIAYYQKALLSDPNYDKAYNNLGIALKEKGQSDDSVAYFRKALQINPEFTEALSNMGNVLKEKGQLDEAISYYQKALQINPNLPGTYNNLGMVFQEKRYFDKAQVCYQKAVMIDPNLAEAHYNLGNILNMSGKHLEALASYDKALDLNPNLTIARWSKCMAQLPIIYSDETDIESSRKRYHEELIKLNESLILETSQDSKIASEAVGVHQPFYLAYQVLNDRELQKTYGEMVCKIMASQYPQFAICSYRPSYLPDQPVRVGIVSGCFHYHSVWKIIIKGWAENLDKKKISLYGYYTDKKKDQETDKARHCFVRFVENVHSFEDLCKTILNDKLDVIIYPEIGMDATTLRLASLRLAPVQCVSWGHPDTTGLPTIDYYLSSELMEPSDAEGHYTEQVVLLPNLSIYYTPLDVVHVETSRHAMGLRSEAIIYLCCQSLYKYLPRYDDIYPRIAQKIRDCQFLFISHASPLVTEQFRLRISQAFIKFYINPEDHLIFSPRLAPEHYQAIHSLTDIYLDSVGWSGGNTTLESLKYNLPVVTLPGKLMRGRHSTAILTMMGLKETIAATLDEYIELAVKLGQDTEWRRLISEKIERNKHMVYKDKTCIKALEDFLVNAVIEKVFKYDRMEH